MQTLKADVEEKIREAAIRVFLKNGFELSSTREIVEAAEVSKGNLYNYFKSKEELFYAITTPFHESFDRFLWAISEHEEPEVFSEENTDRMAAEVGKFIRENRREFIIILDGSGGTRYADYKDEVIDHLKTHFEKNIKQEFKAKSREGMSIMQIVAVNFLEALLRIAKCKMRDEDMVHIISLYLKFHANGVARFYPQACSS